MFLYNYKCFYWGANQSTILKLLTFVRKLRKNRNDKGLLCAIKLQATFLFNFKLYRITATVLKVPNRKQDNATFNKTVLTLTVASNKQNFAS